MGTLGTPIGDRDFNVSPPLGSQPQVANTLQQTLSLLMGLAKGNRIPVRVDQTGMLMVNDAKIVDIIHYTATTDDFAVVSTHKQLSSVLVLAHPDNSGRVWVRPNGTASDANGWPLDAGSGINMGLDNFVTFSGLIEASGDKLIVALVF